MKIPAAFLTLFLTLVVANASNPHDRSVVARHSRLSRAMPALEKKSPQRRCARRNASQSPSVNSSSTKKSAPSSTKSPSTEKTASPPPTSAKTSSNNNSGGSSDSTLKASGKCGSSDAVSATTKTSGPNGSIDFLNCGIDGGGWNPPFIHINDVVVKSLSEAIKSSSSPFHACAPFVSIFNKYGGQFGVPPIFLASFAMQESSCNPNTVGGAGEQGLMQITKDKCGGAPGGDCKEPDFNIRTGAKYFADTLASNGGDVLKSIGGYNGWSLGLTYKEATAARYGNCCRCQQNLDYLHQFLNGWCQNINAYDDQLGKYFNLDVC
ncbi:glycoside hydrolase family 23 protein [Macrolepiota fuliginosa MF-IS2]|uniref:Glycoside hydrolase family 23 protein n=1 Tax=Macrolepiota fuliginosa MF-IS2 TaxID=1400762 RepID=A0A9P5XRI5_9AGAR|nr:glycoside hydrolase family 23 protein [Macrolepiota fuliginosa MF-IS2]